MRASPSPRRIGGVRVAPFAALDGLVWLAEPDGPAPALTAWWQAHRHQLDALLRRVGGLLFRGFDLPGPAGFAGFVDEVLVPTAYVHRSTPRTEVGERVYTATEYPAARTIPLHGENSYQDSWPRWLALYCDVPAAAGGETPLADVAQVTRLLPEDLVQTFADRRVTYRRHYRDGVDLPWHTVFGTRDRGEVEAYCRRHGIAWTWIGDDQLRTEQTCDALVRHPVTGEPLWFNQAHLFHVTSLDDATRCALLDMYGEDALPRNACFGDGSPIEPAMLACIRDAYARCARSFAWQRTDALLIDNLAVAHGRNPFRGERRVLVAMGDRRAVWAERQGVAA
ncbi:MAG TPA: TauD/TfdA family dioxygenase [Kofleriaceae bacterium]|jgi:alpha-ketoglutarate-dependent taurine dioxygenase|nr:TauD/TfdA family dioxygenase [Kofleriaceae bacterium]